MAGAGFRWCTFGVWLGVAAFAAGVAGAGSPARVVGQVTLSAEGASLRDVGPVVVYLEAEQAGPNPPKLPPSPEIRQRNATFTPGFMAVVKGQTVEMPNDDDVRHNVYSTSADNAFDLGIYDAGDSRSVTLEHPGEVDIHCSVHESMNGTIFVSPSPWYATVAADGRFAIEALPPGRYRLRTWSERLPVAQLFLRVLPGATVPVTVTIGLPAQAE